jgi:3,4-dihydroxy 2-butanone 4-phosphate synthase/GTP cyclohydrolase II
VDARDIDTAHGPFRLHTYRDRLGHGLHFALVRGVPDPASPALVRVQMLNPLADALHWRRADFGPAVGDVLAAIAREGAGALVLLGEPPRAAADAAEAMLAKIRQPQDGAAGALPAAPVADAAGRSGAVAEWRRNGAGSQILADLGYGKLRVLGTPRRQVGLAGYGLEVVEHIAS